MTIGSITPTASALAALGPAGSTTTAAATLEGTGAAGAGLFSSLLKDELQTVAGELEQSGGAETTMSPATSPSPAPSTPTAGSASAGHRYVVTYVHGQPPTSSGHTPAPLVTGPTGGLVITAKTTGLTQLTRRFTGTVAHPTAAAEATSTTMAAIASLKAAGQA